MRRGVSWSGTAHVVHEGTSDDDTNYHPAACNSAIWVLPDDQEHGQNPTHMSNEQRWARSQGPRWKKVCKRCASNLEASGLANKIRM